MSSLFPNKGDPIAGASLKLSHLVIEVLVDAMAIVSILVMHPSTTHAQATFFSWD
jgi:hypothetical protein